MLNLYRIIILSLFYNKNYIIFTIFIVIMTYYGDYQVSNLNIDKELKENTTNTDSKDDDVADEQISPAEKSLLQKIIRRGLVETTKDIEIQRKDPSSPLYSVKSFDALHLLVFLIITFFILL